MLVRNTCFPASRDTLHNSSYKSVEIVADVAISNPSPVCQIQIRPVALMIRNLFTQLRTRWAKLSIGVAVFDIQSEIFELSQIFVYPAVK